jgi:hypothetical protein
MPRRKAAVVQSELERALRAAIRVTGRPHVIEFLPGGGVRIVPAGEREPEPGRHAETAALERPPRVLL